MGAKNDQQSSPDARAACRSLPYAQLTITAVPPAPQQQAGRPVTLTACTKESLMNDTQPLPEDALTPTDGLIISVDTEIAQRMAVEGG